MGWITHRGHREVTEPLCAATTPRLALGCPAPLSEPAGGPPSGPSAATSFLDSNKPPRATTCRSHLPRGRHQPAQLSPHTAPRNALERCFRLVGGSLPVSQLPSGPCCRQQGAHSPS